MLAGLRLFFVLALALSDGSQLSCCEPLCGEVHVARNWCLWPRASENLRPANSHMSDLGRGSLSQLSFVMPAAPANTLTVAYERPGTNYPAKPCSETVGDVSCFKLPNFGVIGSTVVDNY